MRFARLASKSASRGIRDMAEFTKEQLIKQAKKNIEVLRGAVEKIPGASDAAVIHLKLAEIALASLGAEPIGFAFADDVDLMRKKIKVGGMLTVRHQGEVALYTAPPAPVSVPDAMEMDDDFDSAFEHGKAVGWNAYRATMLQGANGTLTNEGTITATQFKPVADLYGLTSPTGGETSFTFDAVEARDFIDGGWSCQEYVELGRFQEAMLQNGNSPAQSDCCPEQNYIAPAQEGDSPVLPDGWVACSERMPEVGVKVLCFPVNDEPIHATYNGQVWLQDISWSVSDEPIDNVISCNVFHWMPLPAAPQQEADNE
ncbi:DUF551 domain-containing protein [Enterobacter hormaechei]|uniref:DUF551 domain-containing protein n=1 Tax=Enterobacter hormaechei TaxID=158836 RepID=UPI00403EC939